MRSFTLPFSYPVVTAPWCGQGWLSQAGRLHAADDDEIFECLEVFGVAGEERGAVPSRQLRRSGLRHVDGYEAQPAHRRQFANRLAASRSALPMVVKRLGQLCDTSYGG